KCRCCNFAQVLGVTSDLRITMPAPSGCLPPPPLRRGCLRPHQRRRPHQTRVEPTVAGRAEPSTEVAPGRSSSTVQHELRCIMIALRLGRASISEAPRADYRGSDFVQWHWADIFGATAIPTTLHGGS